jgi:hypothetical protein
MTISFDRRLMIAQDTLINVVEGESVLLNLDAELCVSVRSEMDLLSGSPAMASATVNRESLTTYV